LYYSVFISMEMDLNDYHVQPKFFKKKKIAAETFVVIYMNMHIFQERLVIFVSI